MRIDELRLDELTGYRENPVYQIFQNSHSVANFVYNLQKNSYDVTVMGEGFFAIVFERPGGRDVYKLFTAKDHGYLKYLQYVKANQHNPHVPKIYGGLMKLNMPMNSSSFQGREWYIVRMEKLKNYAGQHPSLNLMKRYIDDYPPDFNSDQELIEFRDEYPELTEVLDWIARNRHKDGVNLDLHGQNVMMRGRDVVITDPFSYFS